MKLLSFVLLLLSSVAPAFAADEIDAILAEANTAPAIDLSESPKTSESTEEALMQGWNVSTTSCYASAFCGYNAFNQPVYVWCQVYGYAYSGYGGSGSSSCQWQVGPGWVSCRGYYQMVDAWGRYYWAWQTFNYRC